MSFPQTTAELMALSEKVGNMISELEKSERKSSEVLRELDMFVFVQKLIKSRLDGDEPVWVELGRRVEDMINDRRQAN